MGKSRKKTLKAALQSQQSRLKFEQKATLAARAEDKGQKSAHIKGKRKASQTRPLQVTVPFFPTNHILLIGEGNFSFARALVHDPPAELESLPAANVTATAFDSEAECYAKYPDAEEIVQSLRSKGVKVLFGVDATKLEKCSALKGRRWDRIVFNFPHAGEPK
jgi:25S rRNA (uracil2634-N3)-methyltransferase